MSGDNYASGPKDVGPVRYRGPYRHVRNPMMTGVFCIQLGTAIATASLWLFLHLRAHRDVNAGGSARTTTITCVTCRGGFRNPPRGSRAGS